MYHFLFLAFSVFTTNNYHLYTAAVLKKRIYKKNTTRMWANDKRDVRPANCRWRPLLKAAKFG